nr:MAG TPA: hypothetical protein [Caudoviricetes sp.]
MFEIYLFKCKTCFIFALSTYNVCTNIGKITNKNYDNETYV